MDKILLLYLFICLSFINSLEDNKDLFDETQIKNLKLINRVFKGAIADCDPIINEKLTDDFLKRYEGYSKHEVGAIITGVILVENKKNIPLLYLDKDELIPEYKKLTDVVHNNGAKIIAQISEVSDLDLSIDEIHRITNLFADTAERVIAAGFDGIEIAANHLHVILSQFLSPLFNHRNDEYGGSDENRARFVVEVIKKIRERIGNDYVLILKINSEDNDPNGIAPKGFITACKLAEEAGIDMIDITGMKWKFNRENKLVYFDIGKILADTLKIPVMITGGAKDLNVINDALNNSNIQYIGMCRALLSEPDLLIKWKECGNTKAQCVSCMKCYEKYYYKEAECIINARKKKNLKNNN